MASKKSLTVKVNVSSGEFRLPYEHEPGMAVPKGGSSCANCKFMTMRGKEVHCSEKNFQEWNGSSKVPTKDASSYCSDFWIPRT